MRKDITVEDAAIALEKAASDRRAAEAYKAKCREAWMADRSAANQLELDLADALRHATEGAVATAFWEHWYALRLREGVLE